MDILSKNRLFRSKASSLNVEQRHLFLNSVSRTKPVKVKDDIRPKLADINVVENDSIEGINEKIDEEIGRRKLEIVRRNLRKLGDKDMKLLVKKIDEENNKEIVENEQPEMVKIDDNISKKKKIRRYLKMPKFNRYQKIIQI